MFEIKPRIGIAVWVYNLHQVRQLRRFGLIYYTSKKMKYVYLYVDQANAEAVKKSIEKLHFVRKVEFSHRPEVATEFGDKIEKRPQKDPLLKDGSLAATLKTTKSESNQGSHADADHIG